MAIYGTPLTMGGGGGGQNETLPPLLDNFKATRLEAGLVPPVSNSVAFKDIPDGSKIKLVKGNNISGTVTYGTTTDLNHRIVFDSNDWARKRFRLENDIDYSNISGSDIDQWLNSTKASGWWTKKGTNLTSPDYSNEQGFLYQLGITDELLAQNFNDININATAKAKVGLPWRVSYHDDIPYTFFKDVTMLDFADYASLYGNSGNDVLPYNKPQTKAPPRLTLYNVTAKIHPMMEPKPDTKVALDVDGSYFMFENQAGGIILSADKMPASRANALAGAVWVYGEHEPKNVNDGTKIELTRDEVITNQTTLPPIALSEISSSSAAAESIINIKESDGKLHPYIYLCKDYPTQNGALLLRKDCVETQAASKVLWSNSTLRTWCNDTFFNKMVVKDYVLDTTVMGESSSTSKDKVFLLSLTEMGFTEPSGGVALGKKIDYFSSDARRIAFYNGVGSDYWTRSTIGLQPYYITSVGRMATISTPQNVLKGLRPAFVLPLSFKLKPTPNKDGSYDMYEESSAQTLATGKTIADLPSKSKVKLGRYGDADLQWLVSRNAENKLILVMSTESMTALGSKILDAAEPSNGNSDRQKYGNNRYIYTNLHQWLNAEKGANQWFVKAQTYDAPPDYTNVAGFLNGWKKEELDLLELAEWTVTKSGIDGSGKETFRSRVVLPSTTEMGFSSEDGGSKLDIFNSDSDRQAGSTYWTRTPFPTSACINYQVKSDGTQYSGGYNSYDGAIRPICSIPETTLVSDTPDSDGCYTFIFTPPLERTVVWDKKKEFYARQFTYNSKKQYQTMLEGAIAYLPIMPDGQELSKLPSKSKVKLGKFNGNPLKWLVCRDSADQSLRLILDGESVGVIGNKMFDNKEPNNSNSNRRVYGNNRYIWSNIRQWLNSSSPANSWYSSQHSADAPPNYTNVAGFLNGWTEKEISVLENVSWVVTRHSIDGGGKESFQNRIVLPSTAEMGLESGTGGSKLDIFNNDGDRVVTGKYYWCRTPYPPNSNSVRCVHSSGTLYSYDANYTGYGVRPLCKPLSNTLVSIETDSEGCFTIV